MRLIDGDKLYSSLYEIRMYEVAKYGRHDTAHCCSLSTALFEIKNAPTIESMEVVRCKDCEFYTEEERWCRRLGLYGSFDPNGYCSQAERREDE